MPKMKQIKAEFSRRVFPRKFRDVTITLGAIGDLIEGEDWDEEQTKLFKKIKKKVDKFAEKILEEEYEKGKSDD